MDDDSLITYSTSMERWKFAYPPQGTCKVVTGILNKKAMELEYRKLPVKPVYSPNFFKLIIVLFLMALQWVMSMIMLLISSTASCFLSLSHHRITNIPPPPQRVDMDIAGTSNSLLYTSSKQEEVPRPWLEDDVWGNTVIQQKIMKDYIENENDALLRYPPNFTGGYSIVNRDITNAWGYPRGYLIYPRNSPIFNVRNFSFKFFYLLMFFSFVFSFRRS